jgi:hypothetical protein
MEMKMPDKMQVFVRTPTDLIKDLEQLGERTVKTQLLNGDYGHPGTGNIAYEHVKDWLSSKESERAEARAEESLSNSRKALRISIWAIIIAIIALLLNPAIAIIIAWFQRK